PPRNKSHWDFKHKVVAVFPYALFTFSEISPATLIKIFLFQPATQNKNILPFDLGGRSVYRSE
ncbi:hypothetical protein, partial [Priestia megaterium]|uniref:hypothetical protein n=1 Tax=Priestia megaterium TaxID=1404 RepID=UPI0036DA46AF